MNTTQKYHKAIADYHSAFYAYQCTLRTCSALEVDLEQARRFRDMAYGKWSDAEEKLDKARSKYEAETLKEK